MARPEAFSSEEDMCHVHNSIPELITLSVRGTGGMFFTPLFSEIRAEDGITSVTMLCHWG